MKHQLSTSFVAGFVIAVSFGSLASEASAKGDKVEICHVPPGNPDNPQTLSVGPKAVKAHLKNHPGDSIGPCPAPCVCDDGDPCTNDNCDDTGLCVSTPKDCDDGDVCTNDACDPVTGECTNDEPADDGTSCDDGILCTGPDQCVGGVCQGEDIDGCCRNDADCETDGLFCTIDTCDETTGNCMQEEVDCGGTACEPQFCIEGPDGATCEPTPVVCNPDPPDACVRGICTTTPEGQADCTFVPVDGCANCVFEWVLTEDCGNDAIKTETLFIDVPAAGDGTPCPGEDGDTRTMTCCICRDKTMPLMCGP